MHDEDAGERGSCRGGEGEVVGVGAGEEAIYGHRGLDFHPMESIVRRSGVGRTCTIPNMERRACAIFAVPEYSKIISLVTRQWYGLDDGCGECAEE